MSVAFCIRQIHQKPGAGFPGDFSLFIEIPHGISTAFELLQDLG